MLWERQRAVMGPGGGRLPRHSPLGGGRAPYEGAQQPPRLELGAFSPHSHDVPASPALSVCLRQPRRSLKVRERAASGTLSAHRSRGALDAAAYAPESPLVRWCSRRDELSADVVTAVACRDPEERVTGPGCPRHGVQRPVSGPAVAHVYPETRQRAGSAVRQAWCLARVAFQRFEKKSVNIICNGCEDVTDSGSYASRASSMMPPVCLIPFLRSRAT